ncbi:MAG: alpha-L-fucosidase, partial [Kiritimatiellae bacterium]|nr:alpha-L-fucosidase [Kiritimatiellia bacterium]
MRLPSFLFAVLVSAAGFATPETLVVDNGALRAEVVPEWGGRLMFFGRSGGTNALWTNPAAAANTVDDKGREVWKNVGGEKTWVGGMGLWKGFKNGADATSWPPPAWFDSAPLEVVRANSTNVLLRSAAHTSGDWTVALEREFTLTEDGLEVREKLLDGTMEKQTDLFAANAAHEDANAVRREQIRVLDKTPYPDDPRRVWSVTQIPFVDNVAVRLVGAGRTKYFCGCPEISAKDDAGWSRLDFSAAPKNSRVALDGDALAAEIPGVGRLVIEQSADARHIGSFVDPSRAIVYTTGKDIVPSKWTGGKASPYIELEFVALGPDAEQRLTFKIVELTECKIQTDLLTTNVVRGTVSRVSDEQIRVSISESLRETKLNRMREDKLGMFIHWGVYSILGNPTGEWTMYKDRIPKEKYDKLADEFCPPASFSPREWVKLAKRAGCRYAVLTTRHHDGFCLFDTKTTDFNSVKTAAKRDFVREFAEACRAEGLRVGFYFSIMNWQFNHSPNGVFDKKVWDEQVRTTHEALRELMTNYGKVDY